MSRQRSMEAILASEYVSIGELVRLTESRYSTLKFYTEEGLLPYEQAEENLTRRYKREETIARIQWIREKKAAGLSIPQIKEALQMTGGS
ncbi:MerR family transcriptional regulator [Paenibacillus faecis]|uniref:helix-turn-helix domain-containing protein n=1 Tax=Paenibacillus faecis TaxID=862114 RepID=UPI001B225494|nr:helix-turn-helix domain-containing protein [Paenibacillus faecis]GIO84052.1 MerR family transcriptional regulator [Paenibacillus faecis]